MVFVQNPEPQGLRGKIFQTKELTGSLAWVCFQ